MAKKRKVAEAEEPAESTPPAKQEQPAPAPVEQPAQTQEIPWRTNEGVPSPQRTSAQNKENISTAQSTNEGTPVSTTEQAEAQAPPAPQPQEQAPQPQTPPLPTTQQSQADRLASALQLMLALQDRDKALKNNNLQEKLGLIAALRNAGIEVPEPLITVMLFDSFDSRGGGAADGSFATALKYLIDAEMLSLVLQRVDSALGISNRQQAYTPQQTQNPTQQIKDIIELIKSVKELQEAVGESGSSQNSNFMNTIVSLIGSLLSRYGIGGAGGGQAPPPPQFPS